MTFQETMEWQRVNAHHISRLSGLGDKLAARLIVAYRELFRDQMNPVKQSEWMKVADDYARRDLIITERRLLQDRFAHKIDVPLRRIDT